MATNSTLQTFGAHVDAAVQAGQLTIEQAAELDEMMHNAAFRENLCPGDPLPERFERALREKFQALLHSNPVA